jgi:hypothetical protein
MRKTVKTISSVPEKFIPKSHLEDKDLDENSPDIKKRPMIFYVRKLNRDEHFKMSEMLEFKDEFNRKRGVIGSGEIAKFIWENNVTEVRNVVIQEGDNVVTYESLTGKAKDDLWNTEGMDAELNEAILYARTSSELNEAEAKN